ncbi:MAG: hypothetical protein R3D71_02200 [Rickettsiales bacterium]
MGGNVKKLNFEYTTMKDVVSDIVDGSMPLAGEGREAVITVMTKIINDNSEHIGNPKKLSQIISRKLLSADSSDPTAMLAEKSIREMAKEEALKEKPIMVPSIAVKKMLTNNNIINGAAGKAGLAHYLEIELIRNKRSLLGIIANDNVMVETENMQKSGVVTANNDRLVVIPHKIKSLSNRPYLS